MKCLLARGSTKVYGELPPSNNIMRHPWPLAGDQKRHRSDDYLKVSEGLPSHFDHRSSGTFGLFSSTIIMQRVAALPPKGSQQCPRDRLCWQKRRSAEQPDRRTGKPILLTVIGRGLAVPCYSLGPAVQIRKLRCRATVSLSRLGTLAPIMRVQCAPRFPGCPVALARFGCG